MVIQFMSNWYHSVPWRAEAGMLFGRATHSDEQRVSVGEQRDQQVLDDVVLSDDALPDGGLGALACIVQLADQLDVGSQPFDGRIGFDHLSLSYRSDRW